MRSSTKRTLSFFISLVLFVASILIYTSLIQTSYGRIKASKVIIIEKKTVYDERKNITDKIQALLKKSESLEDNIERSINLAIPRDPYISQALKYILGLAEINKLKIKSLNSKTLSPQIKLNSPNYVRNLGLLQLSFDIEGRYEEIKNYLKAIETSVRVMDIVNFTIAPVVVTNSAQGGANPVVSNNKFSAKISIQMYYEDMVNSSNTNKSTTSSK